MTQFTFNDKRFNCDKDESVLDALLKAGISIPYSCKNGVCKTCMVQCKNGNINTDAQAGLRDTLRELGYALACQCFPEDNSTYTLGNESDLFGRVVVREKELINLQVCKLLLESSTPLYYHAGQFINLRRKDGLIRSYSLASHPQQHNLLELHVNRKTNGKMSNWIFDSLSIGDKLDYQGPNGSCFYLTGNQSQPMLLIGNGTGLAPLLGIIRDALFNHHKGDIYLYHGSRYQEGLYLHDYLCKLDKLHERFFYTPCLSSDQRIDGFLSGRANDIAITKHEDLTNWRVYLCGIPDMVHSTQKLVYLKGARLDDIYSDPFELTDLRLQAR